MVKLEEILSFLNHENIKYKYIGDHNAEICNFSPLKSLKNNSITWSRQLTMENADQFKEFINLVVVCDSAVECDGNYIIVDNPHKTYFKIIERFFYQKTNLNGISPTSVCETTKLGGKIYIGNFTFIGSDVIIGNNVHIEHNVTITGKVFIGDDTVVESGVVIGLCGFGHYREDDGRSIRVPHLGGVHIGKRCYIGANTTIARGTLSDTYIGDDVKIDALCHIAHNVEIGDRVMMTGGSKIGGSTIIKSNVWIGPNSTINNSLIIEEDSFIGIGSVVTKNVSKGKSVFGIPARVLKDNTANIYTS